MHHASFYALSKAALLWKQGRSICPDMQASYIMCLVCQVREITGLRKRRAAATAEQRGRDVDRGAPDYDLDDSTASEFKDLRINRPT
ncbi:hypothetical protein V492_07924 [Pseudogymnoascus sp. VKM F-4246]|nr:hypothetical protein V492_07924 [Pseudogymnoascus sp. VKM F-4246]